jgi:integrase
MLRTKSGLPKHCSWATDRHGKRRVRFRKDGISRYLSGTPWSDNFMRQYGTALDGALPQSRTIGASRTLPGTINALAVSYYGSPDFRGLKASTAALRRNIIERFRNEHGNKPVARLERKHINDILGAKSKTPQAANNLLKVLRLLLNYAITIGMIPRNPAIGVKGYAARGEGFHTWSEAEVTQFEATYSIGTKERLAFALAIYTGQRISDVVKMGWQHVKDGWIAVRQEKTNTPLLIPMHPELVRMLAAVPRNNLTFLVTVRGATFTAGGFSNWFSKCCHKAGLVGTAHGLRKTAATRLANAGCSTDQIKAITGHRTTKEVERYTRAADQTRLAAAALQLQLRAEQEQNLSQPETRLDKQG